jgi:sugar O-acyltransferase (sialic acid O-acetyltransferase NeuD family)
MRNCIALFGAGGHANVIGGLAQELGLEICNRFVDSEFFQNATSSRHLVDGIVGIDRDFERCHMMEHRWVIAIGDNYQRGKVAQRLRKLDLKPEFPNLISQTVRIVTPSNCGIGNVILYGAHVGTNVSLGDFNIVNTNAVLEHDSTLGDYAHVAPGAVILGRSKVGDYSFLGANSVVGPGVTLPVMSVLGSLSFLKDSFNQSGVYVGCPARLIKGD